MAEKTGRSNPNWKGGFESKCTQCGKRVWVKPSRSKRTRHFCSKPCSAQSASHNIRGNAHWRWQGGEAKSNCVQCGGAFFRKVAECKRHAPKYCSRACMVLSKRNRATKTCVTCKATFEIRSGRVGTYCSRACKRLGQIKQRTIKDIAQKRLNNRIAALMGYSLKGNKAGCKWEALVGYTVHDLMRHLEERFQDGMSWENMGEWHIDHVKPRSRFSYDSPDDPQFVECWAMQNLQPLWETDNLKKGARFTQDATSS